MIDVRDLVYEYPSKRALHGVTLTVRAQTITALVGPNGAGKTTLLRCIAALDSPYAGEVLVDGRNTRAQPREIHATLGYLPDFYGLYDPLSVHRCLVFAARAHGLKPNQANAAALAAASRVALLDRLDSPAAELSRGLRQRLAIAQAIVHQPKVLLLDEPASGLDPIARRELSHLLVSLKESGMTIVVSSHILAELEDYSTEMIIMDDGRVVGGRAMTIREQTRALLQVEIATPRPDLRSFLQAQPDAAIVTAHETAATFHFSGDAAARVRLLRVLAAAGFEILTFGDVPRQLEETYFAEVKHASGAGA